MNKIKIALATVLLGANSSAVFAQTRYDSNASAQARQHRNARVQSAPVLQERNVALPSEVRSPVGPVWYNWSGPTTGGM